MSKYRTASPMTGEVIREYPTMHEEEVDQVLDRARQAYLTWATADVQERTKVLALTAYLYRQHKEELAALMTLEMGKPIAQARAEIDLAAAIFEYYATEGPRLIADERLDIAGNGEAIVRTAPIGPLLGIMPWNYPHYQAARFIAPNLLLGNTVVLKHAANCPQQALRIEALLAEGGAPEGVYNNVFATNEQVARMIAGPIIQGVSLTGSERAGIAVGELAGRHLKKCVLELGGSDPLIVLGDADIPKAVRAAAAATSSCPPSTGTTEPRQRCCALGRQTPTTTKPAAGSCCSWVTKSPTECRSPTTTTRWHSRPRRRCALSHERTANRPSSSSASPSGKASATYPRASSVLPT